MSTSRDLFESILQQCPDLTIEDACDLFERAVRDQPDALNDLAREVLGYMLKDPAYARAIIISHPHLAALSGVLDLIEGRLRAREQRHRLH